MKAPGFWSAEPGFVVRALAPAAALYGTVAARRMARPGQQAPIPTVCVGNMTVGGAGKTPTALALAGMLRDAGRRPAFLSRGYGGRETGPVRVEPGRHGVAEVGDEALLLARAGPTIVSRDRPAGALAAAQGGADVVVMDDGLQNPSLVKDLALAVFDGAVGLGNGRCLPAGPLRAPVDAQWPRIDAAIVIGTGRAGDEVAREADVHGRPVFRAALVAEPASVAELAGRRVLAFAGIGRPAKFYDSLRRCGAIVGRTRDFPDHHPFSAAEIDALLDKARRAGLVPVTTEKDAVRLAALASVDPRVLDIATLSVRLRFADPAAVQALVFERIRPV